MTSPAPSHGIPDALIASNTLEPSGLVWLNRSLAAIVAARSPAMAMAVGSSCRSTRP